MDSRIVAQLKDDFDRIAHITEDGIEFWYARELQHVLGYVRWENFDEILKKACASMNASGGNPDDHFRDITKMVQIGSGAQREINDCMLTRYACYLTAQNGDPRKEEIAFAQAYFALQTRKQEILEQRIIDLNRIAQRDQLRASEKRLSQNIYEREVDEKGFGRIRSKGDRALFGGHSTEEMKQIYGVKSGPLADVLPPVTLAAKNLATEMTNLNVESHDMRGEEMISSEHIQNNSSVRHMLLQRDIFPERLPPELDIKKIERRVKSEEKKLASASDKLIK